MIRNRTAVENASVVLARVQLAQLLLRIASMHAAAFPIQQLNLKVPFHSSFGLLLETGFSVAMIVSMLARGIASLGYPGKVRFRRVDQQRVCRWGTI